MRTRKDTAVLPALALLLLEELVVESRGLMIKCEMKTVTRTVTERALIPGCRAPVGRDSHAAVTTRCVGAGAWGPRPERHRRGDWS